MIATVLLVVLSASPASASAKTDAKKAELNRMAKDTLKSLQDKRSNTKGMYDRAYGYAVFSNVKVSLMISAGGGAGVAVEKAGERRTYMKMGTAGLNIGLGGSEVSGSILFREQESI